MSNETLGNISLVGVPLGFGAGKPGSELGVNAMRLSIVRGQTLPGHIREMGFNVNDRGDILINGPIDHADTGNPKYLEAMVSASENIISTLTEVLADGDFPVILGGDHSIAIPTFSAIANHYRGLGTEIGLIWFDAHADINVPQTSPSGNIHGMPLAALLGRGHPDLTDLCGYSPKLNPAYIAHIGARDVDAGERAQIKELGLRDQFFTMSDIDKRGMSSCVQDAIAIASRAPGGYAVTFAGNMPGIDILASDVSQTRQITLQVKTRPAGTWHAQVPRDAEQGPPVPDELSFWAFV